MKLITKHTSPK